MSASSPSASGSSGMSTASSLPSLIASSQRSPRTTSGAGGRRVALVEDEVEHGEHRAKPLGQQVVGGHAEGDARGADLALGPDEPLRHRRLGYEKGVRDLGRRQAADLAKGERDPTLRREGRVAAREHEREPVVRDCGYVLLLDRHGLEPREKLRLLTEDSIAPDDGRSRGAGPS